MPRYAKTDQNSIFLGTLLLASIQKNDTVGVESEFAGHGFSSMLFHVDVLYVGPAIHAILSTFSASTDG